MTSNDEAAVLAANLAYYAAFRERDLEAMGELWSRESPIACAHPGWEPLLGRTPVMESWRAILEGHTPDLQMARPAVRLYGDTAFVLCFEVVPQGVLVATNVFVREGDDWKMVHHHAGGVSPDVLEELPDEGLLN